ncbi:MAG: hypothetical protein A3G38_01680 [Omnitrophica WOR_2 bacterium RIFCSPLOWO2_12_FULL_51_8]|nr:MAG: hypothetical protein A3G38_01680 [Omnitrophica WOR_2 bacterium RIFCSPLOWO2_12_FULL_51_8]
MRIKNSALALIFALALLANLSFAGQGTASDCVVIYGDSRTGHAEHKRIVELIAGIEPRAVFNTGDLVENGLNPEHWKIFNSITARLREQTRYYPVLGNHEAYAPQYFSNFGLAPDQRWYSLDIGSIHFTVLDSCSGIQEGDAQYQWLEDDLQKAGAEGKFKIVLLHHPLFTTGVHAGENIPLRQALLPVFEKYKVNAVFSGHTHAYERSLYQQTYYIVTGGGGAPLYNQISAGPYSQRFVRAHHFCKLCAEQDALSVEAIDIDSNVIDRFRVPRGGGPKSALTVGRGQAADPELIVFYSPACHNCIEIKAKVMPKIEKEFQGKIAIDYRDISEMDNYKLMLALDAQQEKKIELTLPVFYFSGALLNGKGDAEANLRSLINQSLAKTGWKKGLPLVDLIGRFKNFQPLAVAGAGLVDGINPCAFTVIVFFMSFLALQGYRKRELAVIGLSFILAVFATYLLIGVGAFNFLYRLRGFRMVTKAANISIGVFSLGLGALAARDFFRYIRSGRPDGQFLQLPQSVKNSIHRIIGLFYRKDRTQDQPAHGQRAFAFKLFACALITGFLVSLLEAVCTGQVYLPTIAFVLKATRLKSEALGYLLLYNLMFILPLFAIFLCALFGATSGQFAKFMQKHLGSAKLLLTLLFFALGALLLWRA